MDITSSSSLEDAELAMRIMLMQLLDSLIAYPERSSVETERRGEATVFVVAAETEDLKQLTEGNSRTARSLQMIVNAVGLKSQRRFSLTFRDSTLRDKDSIAGECRPPSSAT